MDSTETVSIDLSWQELQALAILVRMGLKASGKETAYYLYHADSLRAIDSDARDAHELAVIGVEESDCILSDKVAARALLHKVAIEQHQYQFSEELDYICRKFFPLAETAPGVNTEAIPGIYAAFGVTPMKT